MGYNFSHIRPIRDASIKQIANWRPVEIVFPRRMLTFLSVEPLWHELHLPNWLAIPWILLFRNLIHTKYSFSWFFRVAICDQTTMSIGETFPMCSELSKNTERERESTFRFRVTCKILHVRHGRRVNCKLCVRPAVASRCVDPNQLVLKLSVRTVFCIFKIRDPINVIHTDHWYPTDEHWNPNYIWCFHYCDQTLLATTLASRQRECISIFFTKWFYCFTVCTGHLCVCVFLLLDFHNF